MTLAHLPSEIPSYSRESLHLYIPVTREKTLCKNHAWKNMNDNILGRNKFYKPNEERKGYIIQGYQPPCSKQISVSY